MAHFLPHHFASLSVPVLLAGIAATAPMRAHAAPGKAAASPAPASVEELPIDRFDEYQAGTLPPYPWIVTGTAPESVRMRLLAEGESPFIGNRVAGKGLAMEASGANAGAGYGLQRSFTPPPAGPVYLGFDFKLIKPEESKTTGLDMECALTGTAGGGLSLTLSPAAGLRIATAPGGQKTLCPLSAGWWYHLAITISEKNEASLALSREEKPETVYQLGTVAIAPAVQYTTLRFVNAGGNTGSWMLDNVCMGGKVDASRTAWLPFRPEPASELRQAQRKVFCYYYPIYPSGWSSNDPGLSWYTRTTINASAKVDSRREAAGTKLFYTPLPRPPMSAAIPKEEQLILAMEEEVRLGIQMGLDGFVVDFFSYPRPDTQRYNDFAFALTEAAHHVDPAFKIIPAVYSDGGDGKEDTDTPQHYAQSPVFQKLSQCPAVYRLGDGRMLISMWMTERKDAEWWRGTLDEMKRLGRPAAVMTQFNSKNKLDAFSPLVYAMSSWGQRSPVDEHWIELARKYPNVVVAPVASHDIRSRGCIFWESKNFDTLRKTWELAIDHKADWVCLNTWSDYSEQAMAPSTAIGFSLYDLNAYYAQWFKTGTQPAITHDVLYYSYRLHHSGLQPEKSQKWTLVKNGGMKAVSDEIELLGFLKEPGELQIKIGDEVYSQQAPAGITSFKIPLPQGKAFTPEFALVRGGKAVIDRKGQYPVLDKVEFGNMLYHSGVLTVTAP